MKSIAHLTFLVKTQQQAFFLSDISPKNDLFTLTTGIYFSNVKVSHKSVIKLHHNHLDPLYTLHRIEYGKAYSCY